jgi:hypothetical protein
MPTSKASSISACDERTRPLTRAKNQMGKCICESKAFRRAGFGEVIPPGGPIIYSAPCRSVATQLTSNFTALNGIFTSSILLRNKPNSQIFRLLGVLPSVCAGFC